MSKALVHSSLSIFLSTFEPTNYGDPHSMEATVGSRSHFISDDIVVRSTGSIRHARSFGRTASSCALVADVRQTINKRTKAMEAAYASKVRTSRLHIPMFFPEREPLVPGALSPLWRKKNAECFQKRCKRKGKVQVLEAREPTADRTQDSIDSTNSSLDESISIPASSPDVTILGFSSSLSVPSVLIVSKHWDMKCCHAPKLVISEKSTDSNAKFKQRKFRTKPRRCAHYLHGVRPTGSASLKPCSGLAKFVFALLLPMRPIKCLRPEHDKEYGLCRYAWDSYPGHSTLGSYWYA